MTPITVCRTGHAIFFTPQPQQAKEWSFIVASGSFCPEESDIAFSAWQGHKVVAMAGVTRYDDLEARAWAMFSPNLGADLLGIVRLMRRVVVKHPLPRLEMLVDPSFSNGAQLVRLLGMVRDPDDPELTGWDDRPVHVYKRPGDDRRRGVPSS